MIGHYCYYYYYYSYCFTSLGAETQFLYTLSPTQ